MVKFRVNLNIPSSLVELKDAIRHEFSCSQPEMLHAVVNGVITRLQTVICGDGGHIEQVGLFCEMIVNMCCLQINCFHRHLVLFSAQLHL
ncbi:uncharacterized protein TNCT_185611 [Trichonephila clavata]|uniref:Uncharacterized protein n=1 Tax=Trichonephila clavata TaxID=2740835 RepID=A0A8X6FZ12_TRICU|nr:uncharacterized protein TNCT_185611 [Trichonephila clavata]